MKKQPHNREDENWSGYSFDELKYQRAYQYALLEIEKDRIAHSVNSMFSSKNPENKSSSLFKRMMSGLNYFDYAVIAYKLGHRIYKIFR